MGPAFVLGSYRSYKPVTIHTFIGEVAKQTLLGGTELGSVTLSNFFNLHTGVISLMLFVVMGFHFWRIKMAGGVIVPESEKLSHGEIGSIFLSFIEKRRGLV